MILERPDEIADQIGMLLSKAHGIDDAVAAGFCAQQHALRVQRVERFVFVLIIVVSSHVQRGVEMLGCLLIHADVGGGVRLVFLAVRDVGHRTHEHTQIMLPIHLTVFLTLGHPFVLIYRQIGRAVNVFPEPMDAGAEGNQPRIVHFPNGADDGFPDTHPLHAASLGNLIADGVHDH